MASGDSSRTCAISLDVTYSNVTWIMKVSRRAFLGASVIGIAAAGLDLSISNITTEALQLERHEIPIKNLPRAFKNYKIGFLTDPHIGPWVDKYFVSRARDELQAENPDLILLGGDFIWVPEDETWRHFGVLRNDILEGVPSELASEAVYNESYSILSKFHAPDGVFAVKGNHDNWVDPEMCLKVINQGGIKLLINEEITIRRADEKLFLFGTDDYLTGIPRYTSFSKESGARILLTHNPDALGWTMAKDRYPFDLAVAGHTHGGQVKGRIFGAPSYRVSDLRFASGLVNVGDRWCYTSRGVGVVEVPFRINCPPEVTVFTLV
jgi:hypothetical protein